MHDLCGWGDLDILVGHLGFVRILQYVLAIDVDAPPLNLALMVVVR